MMDGASDRKLSQLLLELVLRFRSALGYGVAA
jgi:hypothetical protein